MGASLDFRTLEKFRFKITLPNETLSAIIIPFHSIDNISSPPYTNHRGQCAVLPRASPVQTPTETGHISPKDNA